MRFHTCIMKTIIINMKFGGKETYNIGVGGNTHRVAVTLTALSQPQDTMTGF